MVEKVRVTPSILGYEVDIHIPQGEGEKPICMSALGPHPAYAEDMLAQDTALYYAAHRIKELESEIAQLKGL